MKLKRQQEVPTERDEEQIIATTIEVLRRFYNFIHVLIPEMIMFLGEVRGHYSLLQIWHENICI